MSTDKLRAMISKNADEIRRLHLRINHTVLYRNRSAADRSQWENACEEFHSRYNALAFPGGYDSARRRIAAEDPEALEAALCFVELRPFFFRSGYMFNTLLPKLKRAPLTPSQSERFNQILTAYQAWKDKKKATRDADRYRR